MYSMIFSALSIVVKFTRMFQQLWIRVLNYKNLTIGVLEIENILSKCDDSSYMGSDQVPSFLLRDGCQILAPAIMALFKSSSKVLALA